MNRLWAALALAGTGCLATGTAQAEPVKIAIIETLSGGQAAIGKMFLTAINYGLIKLNDEKAWPDGIKVLEYDNQGGPSEAADKVKAAINDGAHIIIQGASSAIGGQITDDVRKHNLRNPGKEIMYFNVGAEAMEFTGSKCHFYHFRWNGNAEIRLRALLTAMKDTKTLGTKVYVIGQNYSWGHDVQRLVKEYAQVRRLHRGRRRHSRRQQDPGLRPLRREDQGDRPGYGDHRQLEQRSPAADEGGRRFRPQGALRHVLDGPAGQRGQRRRDGDRALQRLELLPRGQRRGDGEVRRRLQGQDGAVPDLHPGAHGARHLGARRGAEEAEAGGRTSKLSVKQLAFAMETVSFNTSMGEVAMRKDDHQALLPLVVATVSKDAKYKVDGTDMGFKPIRLISGKEAASPVQSDLQDGAPAPELHVATGPGARATRPPFAERGAWNSSSSPC